MSPDSRMCIAVAGRYAERARIKHVLKCLDRRYRLTASWLDLTAENDRSLSDAEAEAQVFTNRNEIVECDLLLYFASAVPSMGRCVDLGMALALGIDVIVVGRHDLFQDSIYLRGLPVCEEEQLMETVKRVVG